MFRIFMDLLSVLDIDLASFWEHFLTKFDIISRKIFAYEFEYILNGKLSQNRLPKWRHGGPKTMFFGNISRASYFGFYLIPFWLLLGTCLAPFELPQMPFGSL